MTIFRFGSAVAMLLILATISRGEVIDHTRVDGVATLPQAVMDTVGQQRWFFSHASVGGNMISGMNALHSADPLRYQLVVDSIAYDSSQLRADAPVATSSGVIYECHRGNPGWSNKLTVFENSVRESGWRYGNVDIAMDKLCYVDQDANAFDYLTEISLLEGAFPDTTFVYMTMPLKSDETSDNRLRNEYNSVVREFAIANDKLLFDIADMEAHDPDGNQSTFQHEGITYQKLYDGYTSDGGHLNTLGQERIAMGWYATAAAVSVPEPGTFALLGIALLGLVGFGWRHRVIA